MNVPRPEILDAPDTPLYLDYNATTPVDPRVADAMEPYLRDVFGNPSSGHVLGLRARAGVERARQQVAALLGCAPAEVMFTSGGSEANNHALKGAAWMLRERGRHLVTTAVEHPAVLAPLRWLEAEGWELTVAGVDAHGMVDPEDVARALTDETVLVSVMHANNEVGTIQPIAAIAAACRERGALLHVDAAQSVGKIPVELRELGADLISVAGHKLYAPKGVGALVVREDVELERLVHGAAQESGRRAGTENVVLAVGLGAAADLAADDLRSGHADHLRDLRDRLEAGLRERAAPVVVHGHPEQRLPNTLSIAFPGLIAGELMADLPGLACSAGAACHDGRHKASAVLAAMDVPLENAAGTLRLSVGRFTTEDEVERAVGMIADVVARRRGG